MIVRRAAINDLSVILEMGGRFHMASPVHTAIPYDAASFQRFCEQAINDPEIGFWVAELDGVVVGMTAAIVYPSYFNANRHIAQELFWWVDVAARGTGAGKALIEQIETWAKSVNADVVLMLALADKNEEKMQNLYARRGYRPIERTFIREVM
jgi:GNAT superfamily N-acetyltransferase